MRHVVVTVPPADVELASDRLWAAGANAIEERDVGHMTELRSVLAHDVDVSLARLGALPADWMIAFDDVDEAPRDAWREFAVPIVVNDELTIRPAWLSAAPRSAEGGTEVVIEPGASFGLGDHPTTRLAADATWRVADEGLSILDVGCGSGVLGIIGALRGAAEVVATDIAEAAREATLDNASRNAVTIDVSTTPVEQIDREFDLVLANILAPVLVSMAPHLRRLTRPSGRLVIAGVLAGRWSHVADALAPMQVIESHRLGEWEAVILGHG